MKDMTVINAVQIFMLLSGFTTVCQADTGNCDASCNDVNGTVGEEVIFACSVPKQMIKGCVELYKFQYPEDNDSAICRLPENTCDKRSIFICRYIPDTAMKGTFRFFLQAVGSPVKKGFTVNISEPVQAQRRTGIETHKPGDDPGQENHNGSKEPGREKATISAISAGVGCFIIFIIIIILTIIIIYKKHRDACQERTFQVVAQKDDDN